jgi:hypothetical protein
VDFTKFLGTARNVVGRYAPAVTPEELEAEIQLCCQKRDLDGCAAQSREFKNYRALVQQQFLALRPLPQRQGSLRPMPCQRPSAARRNSDLIASGRHLRAETADQPERLFNMRVKVTESCAEIIQTRLTAASLMNRSFGQPPLQTDSHGQFRHWPCNRFFAFTEGLLNRGIDERSSRWLVMSRCDAPGLTK